MSSVQIMVATDTKRATHAEMLPYPKITWTVSQLGLEYVRNFEIKSRRGETHTRFFRRHAETMVVRSKVEVRQPRLA